MIQASRNCWPLLLCDQTNTAAWLLDDSARQILDANQLAMVWRDESSSSRPGDDSNNLLTDLLLFDGGHWQHLEPGRLRRLSVESVEAQNRFAWLSSARGWRPVVLHAVDARSLDEQMTGLLLMARIRGNPLTLPSTGPLFPTAAEPNLLAFVAHDLNNIVALISGFTELLIEASPVAVAPGTYLQDLTTSLGRARDLADLLGVFANHTRTRREHFPLQRWLEIDEDSLPANIDFDLSCAASTTLEADLSQARSALRHLIASAVSLNCTRDLIVSSRAPASAGPPCDSCGAAVPARRVSVSTPLASLEKLVEQGARLQFSGYLAGNPRAMFSLAAAIESIHRAGGHIYLGQSSEIALLLPRA